MSKAKGNQNIQVFVRVRPTNSLEVKSRSVVEVPSPTEIVVKENKQTETVKTFSFNRVFGPSASQIDVYRSVVHPLIDEVLSGYNCTVFAYGQTGTGKTFTMEGERSAESCGSWENDPLAGIIPRTLSQLFDELRLMEQEFAVRVSFLELYNEELFDLLSPSDDTSKLKIFGDSTKKGAVIISGLQEAPVHSKADVYDILAKGSHKRQTAATLMNAHSSRSHTVFTVTVHLRERTPDGEEVLRTGKMNLVDLAGSENIGRSGAIEKRAREAGNINQSLLTLGRVITALVDQSSHIPYRESKLTRLLQESLGGRTKTSIIATVSPASCNLEETLSTLDYAHRAKNIQNKPEVNQRIFEKTMLKEYTEEIERLQRDLEATQLRTGIYMDQGEYNSMLERLEQLAEEAQEKEKHIKALVQEAEKKKAVIDELRDQVEVVSDKLKEQTALKEAQEVILSNISEDTMKKRADIEEKDYLMVRHVVTGEQLSAQADELLNLAQSKTTDTSRLHEKLDRVRAASSQTESAFQELENQSTKRIGELKGKYEACAEFTVKHIGDLSASMISGIKEVTEHSRVAKNNMANTREEVLIGLEVVKSASEAQVADDKKWLGEFSAMVCSVQESAVNTTKKWTEQVIEPAEEKTKIQLKHNTELYKQIPSKMKSHSEEQKKLMLAMSARADSAAHTTFRKTIAAGGRKPIEELSQQASELQRLREISVQCNKEFEESMALIRVALARLIETEKRRDEAQRAYHEHVVKRLNSVIFQQREVKESCSSFLESEKRAVQSVQTNCKNISDQMVEDISCTLKQCDNKPYLSEVQSTAADHCQRMRDTWSQFGRETEQSILHQKAHQNEQIAFVIQEVEKIKLSVVANFDTAEKKMRSSLLAMDSLTAGTKSMVEEIQEHLNSSEIEVSEHISSCKDLVEKFALNGVQIATPTGATPQRSELHVPRSLAATSPHEQILDRLRRKYRGMSLESSEKEPSPGVDSQESESDTDLSISSEVDSSLSSVNKENSLLIIERDAESKKFNSSIPKLRRPLSQNN